MAKKFPLHPKHPERICWGCDKYCPADSLQCGNGSGRTQHPAELLGDDWYAWGDWGIEVEESSAGTGEKADEATGETAGGTTGGATGTTGEPARPAAAAGAADDPPLPASPPLPQP